VTPMDLHPEDLLEREIRGELSLAEQERLELHSRQCAVCRLERRAREDFRREAESPEAEADVARLLAAMAGPLALQGLQRAPKASPMRYVRFVSIAAAVVTMTGLAAAAVGWSGMRAVVLPWATPPALFTPPPARAAAPAPVARVTVTAPAPEPVSEPEPEPVSEPAPARAPESSPARPLRIATVHRPVPAPAVVAPSAPVADADADAPTMFRRANEARETGDHARAGTLYGMLLNRYASAPEAHAALALFGRMLLDDGNAYGALQCFDDYLRTGGALREDVMLGRALAFEHIGPRASADEVRAWNSLIDAYPGSVHAERARRRLFELQRF
jgi:hypothetical protein